MRRAGLAGLALLAVGCATVGGGGAREELRQALLELHEAQLQRDPAAVAEKLRRMARGHFAFFRGSIGLYPPEASRFDGARGAILGDPHPENVGTFPRAGEVVVDFNDFDQAGYGPFVADLRRLALGLAIAADTADVARKQRLRVVDAAVDGYLAEIAALARGEPAVALRGDSAFGGGLADLLEEEDGAPARAADRAPAADVAAIAAALRAARESLRDPARFAPAYFAVKQATSARGGIASLFLARWRVRVEGAGPGDGDDVVVELKETPGDAARLVRLQRELQERPDQDPLLGHTRLAGQAFRLRSYGPPWRSVSVDRLARAVKGPDWGKKDLRGLGRELGRLLARAHAHARGEDGQPGLTALRALAAEGAALKAETAAVTARASARIDADVDRLRALLAERGPTLGWTSGALR